MTLSVNSNNARSNTKNRIPPSLRPLCTSSPYDIPPKITHLEETHRSLPIVHMLLPNGIEGESKFVLTTLSYSKEEALELNKYPTISNS